MMSTPTRWLKQEKTFIREAVSRGLPVLGVCLGAQRIASASGARVFADDHKEIGWFPIQTEPFLRAVPDAAYRAVNTHMKNVLSHITGPAR
jgi:GMP synthase-like glutamine amidotransferase